MYVPVETDKRTATNCTRTFEKSARTAANMRARTQLFSVHALTYRIILCAHSVLLPLQVGKHRCVRAQWSGQMTKSYSLFRPLKRAQCSGTLQTWITKTRTKKHDATKELGEEFNCDSTEVMRKWKIILAQFRRERKKIADSKASGSGIGDIYKPKWFAFEHLAFIHGRDCPNVSVNTEWQSNQQMSEDMLEEGESETEETPQESPIDKLKPPNKVRKRRAENEDPRIDHALSIMENVNKQVQSKKQDDYDIFGIAVATKLRRIKDEHTRILVLLYDAILGTGKYSTTPVPSPYS
ncbi:uncharacterized protein LOC123515897 isoform X1 [Portunus trituberculatus]|uniref:uncharacterized protein LOC123515897 isoform X1 n=1 Tax=Portunus trituberculatus TaxID=210409 RepID=UPI001E1D1E0B|nr:uncharacterized protein LOC123515897 isoform X1 [Portunus trituberculatus]